MAPGRPEVFDSLPPLISLDQNLSVPVAKVCHHAHSVPAKLKPADAGEDRCSVLHKLVAAEGGCAVIDGGLATELERRGANINDPLWSAKCLLDDSAADLVRQVLKVSNHV